MRILHVLGARGLAGAEVLVRDLTGELAIRGHQVGVVTLSRAADIGADPVAEAQFAQDLANAGVDSIDLHRRSKTNPLRGAWELIHLERRWRPDVLHIHLQAGLLAHRLNPMAGAPVVYTHHSEHLKFGAANFRRLTSRAQALVAISRQTERLLTEATDKRVVLIPNAVPPIPLRPDRPVNDVLRLVAVGRLSPQKDYPNLIEAVAIMKRSRDGGLPFHIDVFGSGPDEGAIRDRIAAAGLDESFTLHGLVPDVRTRLADYDAFVMSSAWEGLPIAMIEAVAAGLPIACTDVGGCAELVEDGRNGFLLPPRDPAALAAALQRLVNNPELVPKLANGSRQTARDYTLEACVTSHEALYSSLTA